MNAPKTFALLCMAALAMTVLLAACGTGGDTQAETGSVTGGAPSAESEPSDEAPGEGVPADAAGEGSAKVPTIVIENGEPVGGIAQLEYNAGEQIRFKVKGDEAEEVHLHGYDVMKDIPQGGGTVEFNLPAEIEGIFEAELEGKGVQILELTVNP